MEISLITYFSLFLCALGGIQGLILAAALFKVSKKRSGYYKWLIALVICVSVTLLGRTLTFPFLTLLMIRKMRLERNS